MVYQKTHQQVTAKQLLSDNTQDSTDLVREHAAEF